MTMSDDRKADAGVSGKSRSDEDAALAPFFAAARAARPTVSAALTARILADSAAELPRAPVARAALRAPSPPTRPALARRLLAALGGWGGLGGLATATLAGVWIGIAAPEPVAGLAGRILPPAEAALLVNLMPEFDDFLAEG